MNAHGAVRHRHLRDLTDDAAERLHHGDPSSASLRQWLTPARLLGDQVENGTMARGFAQQLAPELVRILPGRRREFVDERFDHVALHGSANRAPEPVWDAGIGLRVFDADIWNVVGQIGRAIDRDEVHAVRRQRPNPLH